MSDHNLTRVAGSYTQTVISTSDRLRIVGVIPEQTMAGNLTIYDDISAGAAATGVITVNSAGVNTDSITIGGITITVATVPSGQNQIGIAASAAAMTTALVAAFQAHTGYAAELWTIAATGATQITATAETVGQAGNDILLSEVGTTFSVTGSGTFTNGTNFSGGTVRHICASSLGQAGKQFTDNGARIVRGLAVVRGNTADEVGIVWAPGHSSV